MQRRRFAPQTISLDDRAKERAEQLLKEAQNAPPGYQRDRLLRRARQAGVVSHMQEWLTSAGLRPPKLLVLTFNRI